MTIDFKALAASMSGKEVKKLTKKYQDKKTKEWKQYSINYITSRTVMNRLDRVAGPQNWRDEYITRADGVVVCTLFLRIGDEWVGKTDAGTESDIEGDKGAFADALKRAAAKWGIGRELYGDGTAFDFAPTSPPPAAPAQSKAGADKAPPPYDVFSDNRIFEPNVWPNMISHFIDAGLAKNDFEANGRLRKVFVIVDDDGEFVTGAPFAEIIAAQREEQFTVAALATAFKVRADERAVEGA